MAKPTPLFLFVLFIFIVTPCHGRTLAQQQLYNKVYTNLQFFPCTRLLDRNSQVGCSTPQHGIDAPLVLINSSARLDDLVSGKLSSLPLAAILTPHTFTPDNLNKINKAGLDKVPIVIRTNSSGRPPVAYSPASTYPNREYGLHSDSDFKWNPKGASVIKTNFNFSMVSLTQAGSDLVVALALWNAAQPQFELPLYSVQVQAFMWGATNAEICLRRGFCAPLGGFSVWGSSDTLDENKESVVLSAQLDSNALFHQQAVGLSADVSGVVAVIAAAQAIQETRKSIKNVEPFTRNVVYTLFNGESWGYMGSKRWFNDIRSFKCLEKDQVNEKRCRKPFRTDTEFTKLKLGNIKQFIELNQILGKSDGNSTANLFMHAEPGTAASALKANIQSVNNDAKSIINLNVSLSQPDADVPGIPPSSLNTLLVTTRKDSSISEPGGVVLTDHGGAYINEYYHSVLDTPDAHGDMEAAAQRVCQAANLAARSIYALGYGDTLNLTKIPTNLNVNCDTVKEMLICFSSDLKCKLATKFFNISGDIHANMYTGVYTSAVVPNIALAHGLLLDSLGKSNVHYHMSRAPGINLSDDSSRWVISKDISLPVWTESNWGNDLFVRVFLKDSITNDWIIFIVGLIVLATSIAVIRGLERYGKKLV